MQKGKILFLICIIGGKFCISYAAISREELISYTLDYYSLKGKAEQREQKEAERKAERIAEVRARKQQRLNKIKEFLNKFQPYVELKESFNDNIFLTYTDRADDFITEIIPGIKYNEPFSQKKTNIFLDAGVVVRRYTQNREENVENPYANFLFSYGLGKLGLNLRYNFEKEQRPFSDLELTAEKGFVDYLQHYSELSLNMSWNRFVGGVLYSHRKRSYEEGKFKVSNNYQQDLAALTGAFKLFPKTYFFLEYDHRWMDYTKGGATDREHDEYWVGLKGDILSKLKGLLKFGYEERHFKEGADKATSTVEINLDYLASRRLTYNLEVKREIGTSTISSDDLDQKQTFFLGCNYFPPFNKKLRLRAETSYSFEEYELGRENKKYTFSLLSEYQLRNWLRIVGEYEFQRKDSTNTLAEYENNIASLKLISEF